MQKEVLIVVLALALLLVPVVSAEIFISQPNALYNVGDELNMTFVLSPNVDIYGSFFKSSLVCGNGTTDLAMSIENIKAGEQKSIGLAIPLNDFIVSNSR